MLLKYYSHLLTKHGYGPQAVGWGSRKGKQSLRFQILAEIGDLSNSSILDVGCGFGDLYGYLKYRKIKVKYLGVDINPALIKIGKQIYPKIKLETRDIERDRFERKFDWAIASGIASIATSYPFIGRILSEMFRICKKGVAMNFLGGMVDFKTKDAFYADPEKIYSMTRSLSNRVVIRHDYTPYEFTLYVYKNNEKTPNNVFKEYLRNSKIQLDDKLWHPKYEKLLQKN